MQGAPTGRFRDTAWQDPENLTLDKTRIAATTPAFASAECLRYYIACVIRTALWTPGELSTFGWRCVSGGKRRAPLGCFILISLRYPLVDRDFNCHRGPDYDMFASNSSQFMDASSFSPSFSTFFLGLPLVFFFGLATFLHLQLSFHIRSSRP
jgi:hypothetical protein